ncbi:MAG: hypothetical protein DRP15_00040 [Candidatus Aenigmatarchaeota archaeon]|nr:MAG: hypothetical protein DRP15_00040 [Candidatus Aenigmarchaeota archaeon]
MGKWVEVRGGKRKILLIMSRPNPYNKRDPKCFKVTHLGKLTGFSLPTITEHLKDLNHMGVVKLDVSRTIESGGFRVFSRIKGAWLNERRCRIRREYQIKKDVLLNLLPAYPGALLVLLYYLLVPTRDLFPLVLALVFVVSILLKVMWDIAKSPSLLKVYILKEEVRKPNTKVRSG